MSNLYREWFEVNSEKEQNEKWLELKAKGYHGSEIYRCNFWGKDGNYHREIFVFAE